jgi:pyridoxal phosphate enzyme (YggS family)
MDGMTRERELAAALASVRSRIEAGAAAAGRNADEIELLPVTKFFPASDVAILSGLGCRSFGESREQEAAAKSAEVANLIGESVRWHMVGQIQRNKARSIARWAHAAHSVESTRLVTALDRAVSAALDAGERDEPLRVYVQVSLDGDATRGGVDVGSPELVDEVCGEVAGAGALTLVGLMAIPPVDADPGQAFARLAEEHRRVLRAYPEATGLSAGMSDDLEEAVKHGSTCVRVGTALLGKRPLTSPSVVTSVTSSSPTKNQRNPPAATRKGHR